LFKISQIILWLKEITNLVLESIYYNKKNYEIFFYFYFLKINSPFSFFFY